MFNPLKINIIISEEKKIAEFLIILNTKIMLAPNIKLWEVVKSFYNITKDN